MSDSVKPKLVYILGSGHCGSTLMDLSFAQHEQVIGVGELCRLREYINPENRRVCTCGKEFCRCGFWKGVLGRLELRGVDPKKLQIAPRLRWKSLLKMGGRKRSNLLREIGGRNELLFDAIASEADSEIIVDSSKDVKRLYLLARSGLFDLRAIHLVRNGKAVMNSYVRKYGRPVNAISRWLRVNAAAFWLKPLIGAERWQFVRYEDFVNNPVDTLKKLYRFTEVPVKTVRASVASDCHNIGGNRLRMKKWNGFRLDEKWKQELKPSHRLLFEIAGGALNRYFGYRG